MSDLISRVALLDAIPKNDELSSLDVRRVICDAPAVDAEPVRHAKWIEDGYYEKPSVCSHCGEEAFYTSIFRELSDYDWDENLISLGYEEDREYVLTKWCPHCGAKMDKCDNATH